MTHDLHQLHSQANESLARRLHSELSELLGVPGHISPPDEAPTGRPLVRFNAAQGCTDEGSDIGSGEGSIA